MSSKEGASWRDRARHLPDALPRGRHEETVRDPGRPRAFPRRLQSHRPRHRRPRGLPSVEAALPRGVGPPAHPEGSADPRPAPRRQRGRRQVSRGRDGRGGVCRAVRGLARRARGRGHDARTRRSRHRRWPLGCDQLGHPRRVRPVLVGRPPGRRGLDPGAALHGRDALCNRAGRRVVRRPARRPGGPGPASPPLTARRGCHPHPSGACGEHPGADARGQDHRLCPRRRRRCDPHRRCRQLSPQPGQPPL